MPFMKGTNMLRLIIFDLILNLPDLTKSNNRLQVMQYVYLEIISVLITPFLVSVQSKQKRRKQTNML